MEKRMGKRIIVTIFALFVIGSLLVWYRMSGPSASPASQKKAEDYGKVAEYLSIGANPIGQTAYTWAAGIADVLNKAKLGMTASAEETKGFLENARLVMEGEIEMGFVNNLFLQQAYTAKGTFKDDKPGVLMGVMSVAATEMHIFTVKGSNVKTVYDFKGKRIGIGQPGGVAVEIAKYMLKSLGYADGDFKALQVNLGEQCNMLRDGQLDVGIWIGSHPLPAINELALTKKIQFIPFPAEALEKLASVNSVFKAQTIPAGTYKGQDQDVPTFGVYSVLAASRDVSNETVYQVTKAIMENLDTLKGVHPSFASVTPETVLNGIVTPIHPGAARYYKEIGVKIDDSLIVSK
jgi:TRAP transporter TAXI family solute receptor